MYKFTKLVTTKMFISFSAFMILFALASPSSDVARAQSVPPENPQSGSTGMQGRISSPPPTRAATITTPRSGAAFSEVPVAVNGLCETGLLVKVFVNNIFAGSVLCESGSYGLQIDLFNGQNEIVARVYDDLDQAGPDSNTVTVSFNDVLFSQFGSRVSLSSSYARRGANPGETLRWPITLSDGTGPYAVSVDWGDGTSATLLSRQMAGEFDITHTYKEAGVYRVLVKGTDSNNGAAFLQLVAVANGEVSDVAGAAGEEGTVRIVERIVVWWPAALLLPFLLIAFWLGRRYQLQVLRRQIEEHRGQ